MNLFDNISFERFLNSLQYVWQGMLCIFLVIGIIIFSVILLNKLTSRQPKIKEENKEDK